MLVGGPGIGKTDAMREVTFYWNQLPEVHVAPSSVSRASLADALNEAVRNVLLPNAGVFDKFNSLQVCCEELGTFISSYETEFISTLNKLFDCTVYMEKKRSMKEPIILEKPHLNMISGTTPGWLSSSLPESAWSEGFASRTILVFSGERKKLNLWGSTIDNRLLEDYLVQDLKSIHTLYGQFKFDEQVQQMLSLWWEEQGGIPVPDHPKLEHYTPRRHTHFIKLCLLFSVSRSSEMVVRMEDYNAARELFLETESRMPDVFKAMRYNSDSGVIEETYNFIWQQYATRANGVPEHVVIRFIAERTPSYNVAKIFDVMRSANIITIANIAGEGGRPAWRPAPRRKV